MSDLRFQKLTPTSNVDLNVYEEGFEFIFSNDDIRNIAVSGPYSSGKSSLLESYKKKYPQKTFIHISLAHFTNENKDNEEKEIEDSETVIEGKILNQLIQQIPIENIPQSNFRIKRTTGTNYNGCAANQYIELMCKFNLKPKLPDSLNEYGKNILNLIPVEKKATRNFINEQIKNLIDTGKLKPCNYMGDNKEGQNNLKCNGFREICRKYWEGEVISAFCFIPLKEVKPEEVSYFCIKVQTNGDVKIVKVVFICTELTMSQSIQKLMDFSFFNTSDQKEDGILFLWNNQNDDAYYHGTLSKSDSMNIVRKITEDYLTFDIEDVQERMDMFHIVEGDKLRCNIAAIGVGQIRDTVLYSGNGNKQFMKNMLDSLIENAWS